MRDKNFDTFPQTDISTEKSTIDALNQESWYLRETDIKKAIGLAQRAHQLSLRLQDNTIYERGLAYSCAHLGYFHYTASQYEDALIRLLQARKMFLAIKEPLGEAEVLVHTALVYWGIGEYDKAFGLVFDAISLSKQDENSPKVAWYYFTLGSFYSDLKDFELSLQYYDKAISIFEESKDIQGITRCKNGIGNVYESLNNYEEALQAHQETYSIQETNGFQHGMARSLHDIGNIHFKLNNYKKALSYYEESLQIRKKLQAKQSIITSFLNLGKLYTKTKDYKKALVYLKNALELAEEIK
ncbi:MAG: tetratricopeptide repeat protein, partial [Bacteroidota bacterium]